MTTPTTSINLGNTIAPPDVRAIAGTGGTFFVLNLGYSVNLLLPGHDRDAIAYARDLAQALTIAAALLEQQLEPRPGLRSFETEKASV